jgi:hypothetical protein
MRLRRWIAVLAVATFGLSAAPAGAHTLTLARAIAKAQQYAATVAASLGAPASGVVGCQRLNAHVVYCQYFIDGLYPEAKGPVRCTAPLRVFYLNNGLYIMHTLAPADPPVECTSPGGPLPPIPPVH